MPILFAAGLFALAGCSSTPTHVDKGPIQASTFSFINGGVPQTADFADSRVEIHRMIQDAITKNLAGSGVTKVASGGDVTVAYLVIVGNNASTESINTYFGYGRDAAALEDKAQDAYTDSKNPNRFQAGTLLIDIIDSKTYKLLMRNYVVRPVLGNATEEVRAARIEEAVNTVLVNVRFTH
jgi:Domain of unknown function (DUF4136)